MKRINVFTILCMTALVGALALSACGPAAPAGPTATPEPVTLTVSGMVNTPLNLTDSALHAMTVVTANLTHPKKGAADYTGVHLNDILAKAGVQSGATTVTLAGSDGYSYDVALADLTACTDCLLAFDPTTPGVYSSAMPNMAGKAWVSNLVSITIK